MSSIEDVNHLHIPLQELSNATNGFSKENLIAKGGFGKVYNGVSEKHGKIAIKMFYLWPGFGGQRDLEFKSEVVLLSVYKHENIVSLLGFCDEDGQKILVYKYESKDSLDQHLDSPDLTWIQRLQICIDVARGLQYLHDDVEPQRRILHGDVKSSNILLDEKWKAKISDFGLSKMGNANMQSTFLISGACSTIGYIDPDYLHTGHLTQKSDVYSFGVVLFEVMCGRLTRVTKYNDKRGYLTTLVKIHWGRKTLDEIIYADLHKQINKASFLTFSSIAYQCLMSGNERPTIKEVLEQLEKALDNQLVSSGSVDGDHFAAHLRGQSRLLASSSQSSHDPPSQSWNYDVFISYREADIGNKFVEHLYNALLRKEVVTFIDDDTGARAGQSILKAIEESHIIIILFSRNYASSSWCLEELAIIMKHRHERGQIIIPVFYDVEPSEVRSQTGHYGEAFTMHELYNNNNKIESWRQALKKAADLSERHSRAMVDG
ncbi:putative serine/threonine-protein kinase PBL28 [Bidens hawaiensis]|uniref:putative serine/threonine-protein kinase PBL28 n=1 Tax=Bidens hawaiensis TaxID=980011 RepID=UPI00404AC3B6